MGKKNKNKRNNDFTTVEDSRGTNVTVEDLRGTKNAQADFKLTHKIPNYGTYSLLFQLNEDGSTLSLTRIEKEGGEKERHNKFTDFKIPNLTIPEIVEGYVVSAISSFIFRNSWFELDKLTIPNTIKHIRGNAFGKCIIKELFIPASVCEIQPLAQNSMIYSIKIDNGNKCYDSRNDCNAIIDTANNELIIGCINSTIPDTVTKIGEDAFHMCGCGESMKVVIPQSVLIIGERAWSCCGGLEKAVIASSIIGNSAFNQCIGLKEILLYDSVTQIGESAFSGCESLKEVAIPDSVTTISEGTFGGCRSLEKVVIPNSVTIIGESAFHGCESLKEVVIPDPVAKIEAETFQWCRSLEKVVIPNTVTCIGENAFGGCESLKEIVIPNSVTKIDKGAFGKCRSLEKVVISDSITEIEESTFSGCENLKEVQIPNSVKRIGVNAFRGCKNLERVVIPDSVTFIGLSAFLGCDEAQIIIKKTSLLKAAFDLPIDELLERKRKESKENPKDLELLRFELQRSFRNIYWEFYNNFSNNYEFYYILNGDINKALLRSIEWKTKVGAGRNLFDSTPFVKSIHLFGESTEGFGEVDLYIDKEYAKHYGDRRVFYGKDFDYIITENRNKLSPSYLHNPVLDPSSFVFADLNSNIIEDCAEACFYPLLEYSTSSQGTILNGKYHATIVANKDENGNLYHEASPYLQATCDIVGFLDENRPLFHQMDLYSDVISNYFFVSSYFIDNRGKADCVLLAKIGIDKKVKTDADEAIVFLTEFKSFMDSVTQLISFMIQTHEHRQHALEGAIAKVMARNMSHNIGSHVFSHLVGNSAYERLSDKSVSELHSYISCYEEPQKKEQAENTDNCQLTFFNKYLKNRMDYLSEVTFGVPNVVVAKNIYGEVFKGLDNVRILLNHISGIADFRYGFSLMHNGVLLSEEDIMMVFPGDVLGCQAFYNIIENIIRNTAKHANKKDHDTVMFNIDFIDKKEFPDYFCVEIDDGIKEPHIESLVQKQNRMIDSNILDQNFNLRTYGLGIVEMKASCAFLRQLNMSAVDSSKYSTDWSYNRNDNPDDLMNHNGNLILLKAVNKNGALGYRFFVKKPQELLFVGNWNVEEKEWKKWSNVGVGFIGEDDFVNSMERGKSFSHPFLIYNEDLTEKTLALLSNENESKTLLPLRKVRLTLQESNDVLRVIKESRGGLQPLKDCVWKIYMRKMGVVDDDIYIGEVVSRRPDNRQRRQVVFENHSSMEQHEPNWAQKTNLPELWIDNLSSQTQSKLPLFGQFSQADNPDNQMSESLLTRYIRRINRQTRLEIFEAYHNKIIAMDERIQRFANENHEGSSKKGGKIPVSALFESTNVIVPAIKLDPDWFDEQTILDLERFIDAEIRGAFLLVHYGILERIYKTESLITQHLEAWARKAQRVVVTSGRGSHSLNLPKSVCFANLSSVLNAFTECRSKYLINCLIYQSRRKNE